LVPARGAVMGGEGDGLMLPPMGLGCWAWGNRLLWDYDEGMDTGLQEVFDIYASQSYLPPKDGEQEDGPRRVASLFDTGDSYGTGSLNGRSEALLGRFRKEFARGRGVGDGDGDGVVFATKLAAYPWRITRGQMVRACEASMARLQVDGGGDEKLELAQLHWSAANYAPLQELALWRGIGDMAEQGLCTSIGVSNYGPRQLAKLQAYLASRGLQVATCQVQFSLLSYDALQRDTLAYCNDNGIRVISYSPLALGLLTGKYASKEDLPKGFRGLALGSLVANDGLGPLLREMEAVRADASVGAETLAQVALAWCLGKGTVPIPGAKDARQARQNLRALQVTLGDHHIQALEQAAQRCSSKMVQNVFQTK